MSFAHPSEQEFARFLDYYRIRWVYEPMSFPIAWEDERVAEMFTPDFYLPEHDMYIELTTMKQSLVTPKNRKLRLVRELYPDINVRLLYRKDYQQLLAKAGYGAVEVQNLRKQDIADILISPTELDTRVRALGRKISREYRGHSLVLVGVLKGVTFFLADLARQIKVPFVIDYLDLRRYAGAQPHQRVRIARDIDYPIEGRHVLLVEDIVNTGLTLDYVRGELRARNPASLEVVTLLDRPLQAAGRGADPLRRASRSPTIMSSATASTTASSTATFRSSARSARASTTSRPTSRRRPLRQRPEHGNRRREAGAPGRLDGGREFSELVDSGLIRQVEEIVVDGHRRLHQKDARAWSRPAAYRWLRYEDPAPVARLADGVRKLRAGVWGSTPKLWTKPALRRPGRAF